MGKRESLLIEAGEIYWIDLIDGRRPAIVVSRELLNRGEYVIVVLCTSAQFDVRRKLSNCVPFSAGEFGFPKDCVAQCEAITFVRINRIDFDGHIGIVDDTKFRELIKAIGFVIGSDCEPE